MLTPAAVAWRRVLVVCAALAAWRAFAAPVPDVVAPRLADAVRLAEPAQVRVDGWLGARIDANVAHRLGVVDTVPLLAGYRQKPGQHPWIGEHVGKWLHAATLAWAYTGDVALRQKLDDVVAQLLAAQEPDGYLGTYTPDKRFGLYDGADWDVWSHKYNLLGLLTYHRYTGSAPALAGARRAADLLLATFPARKSILAAGTHRGMAATSVLEPMVLLYRATGDERYLRFADYLVKSYTEEGGPDLVRALRAAHPDASRMANGKAYEMMSNFVGLCEYARTTGDQALVRALQSGWADIVAKRLYVTGTASTHEHFGADHELPNGNEDNVGETCVTVTWIQFNLQLLRLTGDTAYADEIERALYNHLTAAQHPAGADWCYFTALEGVKHYDRDITCCHSSGPRGLALAPSAAFLQTDAAVVVNTLETARLRLAPAAGAPELVLQSEFPRAGRATLTVHATQPWRAGLRFRVPAWAAPLKVDGKEYAAGWADLPAREWRDGDKVELTFTLRGRTVAGEYTNFGRTAYAWGPFVLAAEQARNEPLGHLQGLRAEFAVAPVPAAGADLRFVAQVRGPWDDHPRDLVLQPFADSGAAGEAYRIWFRTDN